MPPSVRKKKGETPEAVRHAGADVIGTLVGQRYEILEELGHGNTAVVYRAQDKKLHREVAVKILHASLSRNKDLTEAFFGETTQAARIDHPNIVRIFDVGHVEDGRPFVVMELIRGRNFRLLQKAQESHTGTLLDPLVVAIVCEQALQGLAAAHALPLLHRDLKPENLMVSDDGVVKLGDFGVGATTAHHMHSLPPMDAVARGPKIHPYAAPESLDGVGKPLPASDVFSMGVVLYEGLTGRTPFQTNSPSELQNRILQGQFMLPRDIRREIPVRLEGIVVKALRRNPAERYRSAQDMAEQMKDFLVGAGVSNSRAALERYLGENRQPFRNDKWGEELPPSLHPMSDPPTSPVPPESVRQSPAPLPRRIHRSWGWLAWLGWLVILMGIWTAWKWFSPNWLPPLEGPTLNRTPFPDARPVGKASPAPTAATAAAQPAAVRTSRSEGGNSGKPPLAASASKGTKSTPPILTSTPMGEASTPGELLLQTLPGLSRITIDGTPWGESRSDGSFPAQRLPPGLHRLRIKGPTSGVQKYMDFERTFSIEPSRSLDLGLIRLKSLRTLTIAIRGPDVLVRVNGDPYTLSGGKLVLELPEGIVEVEAQASNGKTFKKTLELTGDNFVLSTVLE